MDPRLRAAIERQRAAHERRLEAIGLLEERLDQQPTDDTDEARAAVDESRVEARAAFQAAQDEFDAATRDVDEAELLAQARGQMPRDLTPEARSQRVDIRVGDEPLTYRRGGEHNFMRDAISSYMSSTGGAPVPRGVTERLQRHMDENRAATDSIMERAASTTANFAGLTVPQYLTDMVAPVARAMRPFANICTHHDLPPDGMTLNISRITTGVTADIQASEGSAFSTTAIDDTLLTVNVVTIGGYNDLSVQAVMRGTGVEDITVADLMRAYHTKLDAEIGWVGDNTSGTPLSALSTSGIGAVTYTDASPTVAEAWPKLQDAQQRINAGVFTNATHWVMAPRRVGWMKASLDSNNRPLLNAIAGGVQAFNSMGGNDSGPTSYGNTGFEMDGLPVVSDGNVTLTQGAGTEDNIFCVDANELHLWEDASMPLALRFEQPVGHQGQIRVVVFGFIAFTAGRYPTAVSTIGGTGVIAPTF